MSLEETRKKIDIIDDRLAALFDERMALVKEVAREKTRMGGAIFDGERERSILSRVTKEVNPEVRLYTKQLFNIVMDASRAYQSRYISAATPLSDALKNAVSQKRLSFPEYATVACQGVDGAFSALAAEKMFPLCDIIFVKDFEGVFRAVEKGLSEYGVLPIENSSVGSVNAVYDLMKKHSFHIVKSVKLNVCHCLLAKQGVKLSDITDIYSHEHALNQCNDFLKSLSPSVRVHAYPNTALAAKAVAEGDGKTAAALADKQCADIYNLSILKQSVQDSDFNFTRFICICKDLKLFDKPNKISIMVNLPNEAGSLYKILSKFTAMGVNLTKLESRPAKSSSFEFIFYFDFDADIEKEEVLNLMAELDGGTAGFTFLGSYSES